MKRVRDMDRREIVFRGTAAARQLAQRLTFSISPPAWHQEPRAFLSNAAPTSGLPAHFRTRRRLFPLHPSDIESLPPAITARDPFTAESARRLADPIVDGRLTVLGYHNVAVGSPIDWHRDPVHNRVAPGRFWASVPYLDPALGDHKIIWEINRQQHWFLLGRAAWMTGDRRYSGAIISQMRGWLTQNPPLLGINWASMLELAFRSLSWIWALQFCAALDDDDAWICELLAGVDRQLEHVRQNLSYYFSPNTHLLGEALALYVAGRSLPELKHADSWQFTGRRVLVDQIARQVHADGGHAELSAHYHRYALDFYLLALSVARLTGDDVAASFEEVAARLAGYARALVDDRGYLPLIGDDDGGQLFPVCGRPAADATPSLAWASELLNDRSLVVADAAPEEVFWLLGRAPEPADRTVEGGRAPLIVFPESGYAVIRTRRRDHVVFDAGRHGFLNGGHAHADALSLVLSLGGRSLFVDPGTGTYTMDARIRDRLRAPGSHNTALVDGHQHSEPAGPFHWRRVTDARLARHAAVEHGWWVSAEHHGYEPLVHRRGLFVSDEGLLVIVDWIDGDREVHEVEVRWHLEPAWEYQPAPRGARLIHTTGLEVRLACTTEIRGVHGGDELGWYAPVYGRVVPTWSLIASARGRCPLHVITVVCEGSVPPSLEAEAWSNEGAQGISLVVSRNGQRDRFEFCGHDTPQHERALAPSVQAGV